MNTNSPTEKLLSMPRSKPRSIMASVGYRLKNFGRLVFGRERTLRFFLNGSRVFWRLAFELTGEIYSADFHCNAKALTEDFLKRWIPTNGSVIDIGCGLGRWCRISAKYANSVVGIDFDESLIAEARKDTNENNVEYIVGDVTADLEGMHFDLAILSHVIEHIDDVDTFLGKLHNVTSSLIVEVPDFESDSLNHVRLRQNLPFYSDGDHVREYTLEILTDQLARNGWDILESRMRNGAIVAVMKEL